jgi:ferredoxin-NADP reductase
MITVKRVPGGLVSNHLADTLSVGDVIELGAPDGQFVLPREVPEHLLMISAGSGITPVMSMLRHLVAARSTARVTFLHFARSPKDVIFGRELEAIAGRNPNVRVVVCVESPDARWAGPTGRFDAAILAGAAPDFRDAETFLCGPAPFMKAVMRTLEKDGADLGRVHFERFDAGFDPTAFLEHSQSVSFVRSGVVALSSRPLTVLQEAENRGVSLRSGCRAGTCGTCRCKKKKGVVVNVATGEESGPGEEMIYACVSVARGAVEMDL